MPTNLLVSPRFPIHDMLGYDAQAGRLWMSLVDVGRPERLKATTDFLGSEKLEDGRERAKVELGAAIHGLEELHPDYGRDRKCSYFFHNLSLVVLICADGEVPARQVNRRLRCLFCVIPCGRCHRRS